MEKRTLSPLSQRPCRGESDRSGAFSLLEMIGVMAVIAILALALTPLLIRQIDQAAWDAEAAQLKAFADSFRQGVLRSKSIPSQTSWDSMIATNLSLSTSQIRTNARRTARVFLIDPALQVGGPGSGLPYTQTPLGSSAPSGGANRSSFQPVSARLMIISSLSKALPASLTSGVGASSGDFAFNNIWSTAERALPSGTSWANWGPKGSDLKIQRIQLADLFIQIALNNLDAVNTPTYYIDGIANSIGEGATLSAFFLNGSQISFEDCMGNFQYSEVLHKPKSFDYVLCNWRGTETFLGRTIQHPSAIDMQIAADAFLSSSNNPGAKAGATVSQVYQAMIDYMKYFIQWRQSSLGAVTNYYLQPAQLGPAQANFNNSQLGDNLIDPGP